MVKLSILIPTLSNRSDFLNRLMTVLNPQISEEVEVITELDSGQISIGEKRNNLLNKSKGEYISFVDDDDLVSHDYVKLILKAIKNNPDVVGMHLLHYNNNVLGGLTYHSLQYSSWFEELETTSSLYRYYRNPNHLNPVKRELAVKVKFPPISMGEDRNYSMRLLPLLKTEAYIVEPIYYYLYRTK